jgi:SPP1 family predicted phage head-tail adaptor
MIGEMRHKIQVYDFVSVKNSSGGIFPVLANSYDVWAKVENRSGGRFFDNSQNKWEYEYRITIRYNSTFKSDHNIYYDGKIMAIKEMVNQDEKGKRFLVLKCGVIDDNITKSIVMAGTVYRYEYSGVGGEFSFQDNSLINRRIVSVFKDGIGFSELLTTGTPTAKQVVYNDDLGTLTFAIPFEPDEKAFVLYQYV